MRADRHGPATSADPLADLGAAGPGREVDEELAVAFRAGDRRGDDARVPRPAARARVDGPLEDLAMDRRIADDAVVGPPSAGLELRLDQRDDRGRPAPSVEATGPRTSASEMNETSIVGEPDRLGQRWRRSASRAFVRSIDTTRGSRRSDSASWPRPTSSA